MGFELTHLILFGNLVRWYYNIQHTGFAKIGKIEKHRIDTMLEAAQIYYRQR